jgi:uridine phosphorylase
MMMQALYPILEHDGSTPALIEPSRVLKPMDIPERCVLCFFQDVIGEVAANTSSTRQIGTLNSEMGLNPIYELTIDGQPLALVHPGMGAAFGVTVLEELIALGCRRFIACGGAGVLNPELALGHVVVPTAAIRDEGASYHYLPPSRDVAPTAAAVTAIEAALRKHHVPYVLGKTWTTDAIYRETPAKIARRRDEGCLTVEMEAASFFAVAQFRGVTFGQLLYSGDDLSGEAWDHRDWQTHSGARDKLFWLAVDACLSL